MLEDRGAPLGVIIEWGSICSKRHFNLLRLPVCLEIVLNFFVIQYSNDLLFPNLQHKNTHSHALAFLYGIQRIRHFNARIQDDRLSFYTLPPPLQRRDARAANIYILKVSWNKITI